MASQIVEDSDFQVSILGLKEEGQWCAIALEMSLRGYGQSFEDALNDLESAMEAQISFAVQHGDVEQLFFPAEHQYFEKYSEAKSAELRRIIESQFALRTKPHSRAKRKARSSCRAIGYRLPSLVEHGRFEVLA